MRLFAVLCLVIVGLALSGCDLVSEQTDEYLLRGNTMGTSYTIKALHARGKVMKKPCITISRQHWTMPMIS